MKALLIIFSLILFSTNSKAQPPQGINYQGIARNSQGNPLINQNISIRLSVLDSIATGQTVFVESHIVMTNNSGLFNLTIGGGNVITGSFAGIKWEKNDKWLQIEMDTAGGNIYFLLGTTQFLSVPYALYSKESGNIRISTIGDTLFLSDEKWILIPNISGINSNTCPSNVIDFDNNSYQTLSIGNQCWLKENLRTSHYSNGDTILQITSAVGWSNTTAGAWCWYDNNTTYNIPYGKLYNWHAMNDPRSICPIGFHVPSRDEVQRLSDLIGGKDIGGKMKEVGLTHWASPNTWATNQSGFTGIPAGIRYNTGDFDAIQTYGYWWTSTISTTGGTTDFYLSFYNGEINFEFDNFSKAHGNSIRCIKN